MLKPTDRLRIEDHTFDDDEANRNFSNLILVRVSAKNKHFENANFDFVTFENCYFRNCTFVSCTFTGSKFLGCNLRGSKFARCKFDYAIFERTRLEEDVLEKECPQLDNLKLEFARSLRTNYQQLGDAAGVNRAIRVELRATESYLHNAWRSKATYYRQKYRGFVRFVFFLRWLAFTTLDFLWGNGESPLKLLRTTGLFFGLMAIVDALAWGTPPHGNNLWSALAAAPSVFLGTASAAIVPRWYFTLITAIRYIAFGAFVSILTKRLSRR